MVLALEQRLTDGVEPSGAAECPEEPAEGAHGGEGEWDTRAVTGGARWGR